MVLLLLVLLVVEMATTCSPGFPLAGNDLVSGIFKLLNFDGSTAVDLKGEVGEIVLAGGGWHDDEGSLGGGVVGVQGCSLVRKVIGFLVPLVRLH